MLLFSCVWFVQLVSKAIDDDTLGLYEAMARSGTRAGRADRVINPTFIVLLTLLHWCVVGGATPFPLPAHEYPIYRGFPVWSHGTGVRYDLDENDPTDRLSFPMLFVSVVD